jgi:signal transduction histidine kinase
VRGLILPVSIITAAVVASTLLLYVETRRAAADLLLARGLDRAVAISAASSNVNDDGVRARIADSLSGEPVSHVCIYREDGEPTCAEPIASAETARTMVQTVLGSGEPATTRPSGTRLSGTFELWYPLETKATPPSQSLAPGPPVGARRVVLLRLDSTAPAAFVDRTLLHASLVTGLLFLLLFLTFRQKRFMEREHALERERESERRFAELGRLSAVLAHEIRNPLGAIKGFAQLTARHFPDGADAREDLDVIISESTRLEGLVQGLLNYAKPQPPNRTDFDLAGLVARTVALVREAAKDAEVSVETDLPPALEWPVDSEQMTAALLNLLRNAIEAMPDGGELFVSLATHEQEVRIEVTDDGVGIPAELLSTLFDPYVTGKATGTGLGLAVTRRIIHAHNGTIDVTSAPHDGTTMTIRLPKTLTSST